MTPKQKTLAWLGGGVALMVVGTAVMFLLARSCTPSPPPELVLSKETTWFTGPLRADGGIDWNAALEAEARAAGLKDEENGAPVFLEARDGIVSAWDFVMAKEHPASDAETRQAWKTAKAAFEALEKGELDAPYVDVILQWLDGCAPALEKAGLATERSDWFFVGSDSHAALSPAFDLVRELQDMLPVIRLRIAARTARREFEDALHDAASACVLARQTGSPASLREQIGALEREVEVLEQLRLAVSRDPPLPADRVLAIVDARPARWTGEVALREILRAARLAATISLDDARFETEVGRSPRGFGKEERTRTRRALGTVDLNPHFRRVQRAFDDLESRLLGGNRSIRDRLDDTTAILTEHSQAYWSAPNPGAGPLGFALQSEERLVARKVDEVLARQAELILTDFHFWVKLTGRRDTLIAELAARAGAPERRDSWLGERLIVTRNKDDGSIEIGGALIDLARVRSAELDEE